MNPSLSYIIATRDRLPFLKITLTKLITELQPDEEIIVVDGDSSDGSKEFLQQLYQEKKIDRFISEPDKNQAHAWNKAILQARGTIIKKVIDDDVFCYEAIRKCKQYMLENPQVDVVISNDLRSNLDNFTSIHKITRFPHYESWKTGLVPSFTFGDVHMLIRRTSLAIIGLYNISFTMMDWEYSLRISYLQASIAYYTGYNALNVAHSQTITSLRDLSVTKNQGKRAEIFYEYLGDGAEISNWSRVKIFIGKLLKRINSNDSKIDPDLTVDINSIYDHYYNYISEVNNSQEFIFDFKKN